MAQPLATKRLSREFVALRRNPVENIVAKPLDENILEWHYVIRGTEDPYTNGYYHGVLRFPAEYPLRPPSVLMFTPSGRFKTNRRLCLSMSDFHPESWNPMWSVATILTGLYSFMLENQATLGSVDATPAQRRKFAAQSLPFNCADATFRALFPDLVELNDQRQRQSKDDAELSQTTDGGDAGGTVLRHAGDRIPERPGEDGNILTFLACVGATVAVAALVIFTNLSL
mmetsp:Transcript_11720/g.35152  ORF Transcript_11720/g.35152 Transcript_11720/m.35152 type:complete len:228 (-) Transcript_11720:184-867(-)